MTTRVFVELPAGLRPRLESLVDCLIDLLDTIDGDADAEDDAPPEGDDDEE